MRKVMTPVFLLLLFVTALPFQGHSGGPTYPISTDVRTTRERTVRAVELSDDTKQLKIDEVDQYAQYGYSYWIFGDPVDYGGLLPNGATPDTSNPTGTLLTFFTMSDIHISDKESPAQSIYQGVMGTFGNTGTSAYSPVMMSTTHVLDAAVQTINALHRSTPFDFGISLGDDANSNQYNELRWFIDVMDGKWITPSSGAHRGAHSIDYQRPYQSAGLDKSIPWYAVIGNHDQFWWGSLLFNDYARSVVIGKTVLDIGIDDGPPAWPSFDLRGSYMGVIDGTTPYGTPIGYGPAGTMAAPIVVADPSRRALSTGTSTSLNWMKEFFNTTSKPKGHGLTQYNLDNDFACYTFEPKASVPLKVIVLDDTMKENPYGMQGAYALGGLDQARYDWLVEELDRGQAEGKLMIIAAHVPVQPQTNVPDAPGPNPLAPMSIFLNTCMIGQPGPCGAVPPYNIVTDTMLLQTLHNYSNLILWISGHRHINTVTPQPEPPGTGPEFGFWEVETASLRDHPQQFRTFQIVRNDNNTVSIFITDVDPAVQGTGSPAEKSRGYALGASRISAGLSNTPSGFGDTTSHVYNAELIKPLASPYTITVNVTGQGTVKMGPYQAATCTVAKPCSAAYLPGTQVALVATAASGAAFAGWSTCSGTSTCNITMTGNVAVTATFTKAPTLAVTPAYKNFGNIKRGKRAIAMFTVKNTATKGVADLTIGTITPSATDGGQFGLTAGKDRCSGKTIKTGKTCAFQVFFAPSLPYTRMGTVSIPSNDPNSPMALQITGVGK